MRCVGRRYPNAPVYAVCGCHERPPPHFFGASIFVFDGSDYIFIDSFLWVPWHEFAYRPNTAFDPRNIWFSHLQLIGESVNIEISTARRADGAWLLRKRFSRMAPGQFGGSIWFEKVYPTGFPKWGGLITMPRVQVIGWPWAQPTSVPMQLGNYAFLPPNTCDS